MSTTREDDTSTAPRGVTHPELPDRFDGASELNLRETLLVLFYDPDVRNYTIAAFSALAMMFLVMLEKASDIGGAMIGLLGVAGILFRWVAIPPLILLALTYFTIFPLGVPVDAEYKRWEIEEGHFRVLDIVLVMSALVYVACHYRIIGIVHQATAYEGATKRRDERPTRRPPAHIAPAEVGVFLGLAATYVVLGQVVWLVASGVEINPAEEYLITWVGEGRAIRDREEPGVAPIKTTIFLILLGLLVFGTLLARIIFGYWRLRMMGAAEGGMILLDGGWDETKRERSRLEKWRVWGRRRIESREKAQAAAAVVEAARARATAARADREPHRSTERRSRR